MSAVLGPIHEWMYNKIIVQEKIITEIVKLADEKDWEHSVMAKEDFQSLEEVIDLGNIHGSLFGMIEETERRYANLVAELLQADNNMSRYSDIEKVVGECGTLMAISSQSSAVDTYQQIESHLLDGMPCDHVMKLCKNSNSRVEVMRTLDTHSSYWTDAGLTGDIYFDLRAGFVSGLLSKSGYCIKEIESGIFEIVAS